MSNEFAPCPLFGDDLVDVGQLPCGVSTVNCGRCGLSVPATDDESTEFRCDALPPLPEPIEVGGEGWDWEDFQAWKTFTADQMQEYGTACVVAAAWAAKGGNGVPEAPAVEALPQLPEPKYCADDLTDIFTADQMQAYARAAVEADRVQRREHCRWPTCESEAKQEEIAAQAYRELYSGEGGADRVQQGEPVAYGATDFGYTLAGVELEEGDKRVLAFIVNSFGSDHPSVLDLTALFFRRAATKAAAPADAPTLPTLPTEMLLKIVAENTGKRINLSLGDLDLYLAVAREAIAAVVRVRPEEWMKLGEIREQARSVGESIATLKAKYGIDGAAPVPDTGIPTAGEDVVGLLREARATLEMWKDVAPAVSLCADIDKVLASGFREGRNTKPESNDNFRAPTPEAVEKAGWKWVPVEPTEAMMGAAEACSNDWPRTTWKAAWGAMISAAPSLLLEAKAGEGA